MLQHAGIPTVAGAADGEDGAMKKILFAITLTATVFSGLAGADEVSKASVDKLLVLSGIHGVVSQFPGMLRVSLEQARQRDRLIHGLPSMSDDDYQALEKAVLDAFSPVDILQAIGDEVRQSLSERDAQKMLAWYGSELGKKIGKAEAGDSDASRDKGVSVKSLMADKERVAFAMKLDKLLHMTDMSMQFRANARLAMLVAFSTKKNEHRPANMKALKNRISAALQKKRYRIRQAVITSTVYTYRRIDMKDLAQYRAFLETPASLRFNQALMAGMDTGMGQAIDHMARSLESLMKKRHLQKA
jgi:hypothetical protein